MSINEFLHSRRKWEHEASELQLLEDITTPPPKKNPVTPKQSISLICAFAENGPFSLEQEGVSDPL